MPGSPKTRSRYQVKSALRAARRPLKKLELTGSNPYFCKNIFKPKPNNKAMIKIKVKSVLGSVLFEYEKENNTLKDTVLEAIKQNANLSSADLSSADLSYANLSYANLRYADLSYADLSYADLRYANLRSADLSYADLSYADLSSANLRYANLRSADLSYADLSYADLSSANLRSFRTDVFDVLIRAQSEVPHLKAAIKNGRIDGSVYEGECCCLNGTLSTNASVITRSALLEIRDASRPAEVFFMLIKKGDSPETSSASKIALQWVEEFQSLISNK